MWLLKMWRSCERR